MLRRGLYSANVLATLSPKSSHQALQRPSQQIAPGQLADGTPIASSSQRFRRVHLSMR
jgi:hypothetical protein